MPSSSASLSCRLDWRPSPLLQRMLMTLGGLGAASLWLSAWPKAMAVVAAISSLVGGWYLARRESAQPAAVLVWKGGEDEAHLDFGDRKETWRQPNAVLRGPIAVFSGVDAGGQRRHLCWWPDTLDARSRRSLRLAASADARPTLLPELF